MYLTQNIDDEKLIREEYFNLKKDERKKLRYVMSNLSKHYKNFDSIIVSIEKDIEIRYKSQAQPKL